MTGTNPPDLSTATATETAAAVRSGAVTALEVCDAAIDRIEQRDGPINAVVVRDFERAREAARQIDASRTADDPRPLLGVAMTVKDSNDVADLPSTWGIEGFRNHIAAADSLAVTRLKSAGAVILGKTNVSVGLMDWQSDNPIYGRTVNPHDHSRSPGGSSGGAAAAVAAGMVPLELGSDIGGSVRIPAHFCGLFGHKPSYGIIPMKGHGFPGSDGIDIPLAALGPLARSAGDIAVALDIMAGPVDGEAYRLDLPAARHKALPDYRILVIDDHPRTVVDGEVRNVLTGLAEALDEAGAHVTRETDRLPGLMAAHGTYIKMLTAVTQRGIPGAETIDAHGWMELVDEQMRITRAWRALFETVDVVLTPPFGVAAFPHQSEPDWAGRHLVVNGEETEFGGQIAWPGLATLPGLPATVAPVGTSPGGLPIGVQIIAAPFGDRTSINFARLLQEAGLTHPVRPA
jgi:amidase